MLQSFPMAAEGPLCSSPGNLKTSDTFQPEGAKDQFSSKNESGYSSGMWDSMAE